MTSVNGVITIEVIINPGFYWVISGESKLPSLVGIYDIVPNKFYVDDNNEPSQNLSAIFLLWKNHNARLKDVFSRATKIEFHEKLYIDGTPFGDISIHCGPSVIELKKFLLNTAIAIVSKNPNREALIIKEFSITNEDLKTGLTLPKEIKRKHKWEKDLQKPKPLIKSNNQTPKGAASISTVQNNSPDLSKSKFLTDEKLNFIKNITSGNITEENKFDDFTTAWTSVRRLVPPEEVNPSLQDEPANSIKLDEEVTVKDFAPSISSREKVKEWITGTAEAHIFPPFRSKIMSSVKTLQKGGSENFVSPQEGVKMQAGMGRGSLLKAAQDKLCRKNQGMGRGQMLKMAVELTKQSDPDQGPRVDPVEPSLSTPKKYFKSHGYYETNEKTEFEEDSTVINDCLSDSISSTSIDSIHERSNLRLDSSLDATSSDQEYSDALGSTTIDNIDKNETVSHLLTSDPETLTRYLEIVISFGGLLHGNINISPAKSIHDMDLHQYVLDSLEKRCVQDLTRCQSYSIPVILTRRNYVLIGPPRSGKSVSFVIPIISLLMDTEFYKQVPDGNGPLCVVITSCAESVKNLARLFPLVYTRLSVIATYGGGLELERKDELTNGCDILISTPRCWLRLLTEHKYVTNEKRLCHIVIDDMDLIASLYKPELLKMLRVVDNLSTLRGENGLKPQTILIGESWTPLIEEITTKRLEDPVLCMTSHEEAALYARVTPKVHYFLTPDLKQDKLIELLHGKEKMRCAVICKTTEEVILLRHTLAPVRDDVLSAHGNMHHSMLRDVYNRWITPKNEAQPPLVLACDDVLNDIGVNNAQWLLHYSLPANKTNFSNRFSLIKSYFQNRINNPKLTSPDCYVDIFIDDDNIDQYPEVVSFLARLGKVIPAEMHEAVKRIKTDKESKKVNMPLCEGLLQFGKCWKEPRCKAHHLINPQRDKPRGLPEWGYIRIKILQVYTPVHFAVRLLGHTEKNNFSPREWTPWPNSYGALSISLNSFYSSRENRKRHGEPRIGDLVAIEVEPDIVFMRAVVTEIECRDSRWSPTTVKVHYIDQGLIESKNVSELIFLPPDLKESPRESVDVYLCGLLPVDLDRSWSYATTSFIKKKIKSQPSQYEFVAKIVLCLGQYLIVDSLKCIEYISIDNYSLCHLSIRQTLLEHNLAIKNAEHLKTLYRMCHEGGLNSINLAVDAVKKRIPRRSLKTCNGPGSNIVRWAHLPRDEIIAVNFIFAKDPSSFCVKRCEFHQLLVDLEKDISIFMKNQKERLHFDDVKPNAICLALCQDKPDWNRAIMIQDWGQSDHSNEYKVPVRFVDYGDVERLPLSSLAECPDQFIKRLPFQAIECELVGIDPLEGQWSDESIDALYEMCEVPGLDQPMWKNLDVKVCDLLLEAEMTGGRHYKVVLLDNTDGKEVILNKEFMFRGYANWNNKDKHLLDEVKVREIINGNLDCNSDDDYSETTDTTWENDRQPSELHQISDDTLQGSSSDTSLNSVVCKRKGLPNIDDALKYLTENESEFEVVQPEKFFPEMSNIISAFKSSFGVKSIESGKTNEKVKKPPKKRKAVKSGGSVLSADHESGFEGDVSELDETILSFSATSFEKGVYTPNTTWKQNAIHVYINILIPDLKKYYLEWTYSYIYFSTVFDDKCYRMELDFYGPIIPERLTHTVKGLSLEIKMEKLVQGVEWGRLTYENDRNAWLHLENVESTENESLVSNLCSMGEMKLKLNRVTKRTNKNIRDMIISVDDDFDEDYSSHSDPEEFSEVPPDPYNPIP